MDQRESQGTESEDLRIVSHCEAMSEEEVSEAVETLASLIAKYLKKEGKR